MAMKIASVKKKIPSIAKRIPNTSPKRPVNAGHRSPNSNDNTVPVTAPTAKVTAATFDHRSASRSASGSSRRSPRLLAISISAGNATPRDASTMWKPSVKAIWLRAGASCEETARRSGRCTPREMLAPGADRSRAHRIERPEAPNNGGTEGVPPPSSGHVSGGTRVRAMAGTSEVTEAAAPARHRVVVVGGGFGGLFATRFLRRAPVDVTLVDRVNHHLFQPLLYQVATGILSEGQIAPPIRNVLRRQRNTRVELAQVVGFDLDRRTVTALRADAVQFEIPYDSLIVAA